MPPASSIAEAVGAASATCTPDVGEQHEPAEHGDHPDQAELLGDDGEDEVAVGQRQVAASFAVPRADADAGEAARGDADHAPGTIW